MKTIKWEDELNKTIDSCCPKIVLTSSCGIEGAKGPQPYKPVIQEAIRNAKPTARPLAVVYLNRPQMQVFIDKAKHEFDWLRLVAERKKSLPKFVECVPTNSSDTQYIIYTSGTTGLPKGVVRDVAGPHSWSTLLVKISVWSEKSWRCNIYCI